MATHLPNQSPKPSTGVKAAVGKLVYTVSASSPPLTYSSCPSHTSLPVSPIFTPLCSWLPTVASALLLLLSSSSPSTETTRSTISYRSSPSGLSRAASQSRRRGCRMSLPLPEPLDAAGRSCWCCRRRRVRRRKPSVTVTGVTEFSRWLFLW